MRKALLLLCLVLAGCGRGGSAPTVGGSKVERPVPIEWNELEEGVRFTTDARALAEAQRLADAQRLAPAPSPTSSPARPRRKATKLPATLPELRALLGDDAWRDRAGEVAAAMLAAGAERDEIATIAARLPAGQARPVRWALARWSARDGFVTLSRLRVIAAEKPEREPPESDAPPLRGPGRPARRQRLRGMGRGAAPGHARDERPLLRRRKRRVRDPEPDDGAPAARRQ